MSKVVDNSAVKKNSSKRASVSTGSVKCEVPSGVAMFPEELFGTGDDSCEDVISELELGKIRDSFNDLVDISGCEFLDIKEFIRLSSIALSKKPFRVSSNSVSVPHVSDIISPAIVESNFRHHFSDEEKRMCKDFYKLGVERALFLIKPQSQPQQDQDQSKQASSIDPVEAEQMINDLLKLVAVLTRSTTIGIDDYTSLNVKDIALRASTYFSEMKVRKQSYTVPHLAYALGFASRKDMLDFVKHNQSSPVAYVIKRSLTLIEAQRNVELVSGQGLMAGHKEDLQTNFDWGKSTAPSTVVNNSLTNNTTNVSLESLPPTLSVEEWTERYAPKAIDSETNQELSNPAVVIDTVAVAE